MSGYKVNMIKAAAVGCMLLLLPCLSVGEEMAEFGVFPMSGPEGMLLVMQGKPLHPSAASANGGWVGYHIYRKGAQDTGFVRITEKPLSRVGSLAELETFAGGPVDGLERLVGATTKQELWEKLIANDSSAMVLGIFSRSFFEAMGLVRWDRKVEKGKTYSYRATRVDGNGKESAPSEAIEATLGKIPFALVGPLDPKASNEKTGVVLGWRVNPDDSGALSYSIYRSPDLEGSFLRLNKHPLVLTIDPNSDAEPRGTFTDSTAQQGREYYYAIVSVDYAGNESPRDKMLAVHIADVTPPPIPQNVFADPSSLGISIKWDEVNDPGIAGYHIYRSQNPDSFYVKITEALLPYDTGFYEDKTATASDRAFYRITAVDQAGNESEQSARALSLYENYVMPLPPQGVKAERAGTGIRVTWSRNEEEDIQGYYVYRADSYGGELTQISPLLLPDTLTYLDSSQYLSSRGEYWYLLQAINHTGISSQLSSPVSMSPAVTESTDAPQGFWGYYDYGGSRLFWKIPDENMVSGYNLYRASEADSTTWTKLHATPLDRTVSEYRDTAVLANQQYRYRMTALNPKGEESGASYVVKLSTFVAVAPAPGGMRVTNSGGVPVVIWNPAHLSDLQGYRVYRRETNSTASVITEPMLPSTAGEYRDKTAVKGRKYFYSISSVDKWGRESERSTEIEFLFQ